MAVFTALRTSTEEAEVPLKMSNIARFTPGATPGAIAHPCGTLRRRLRLVDEAGGIPVGSNHCRGAGQRSLPG